MLSCEYYEYNEDNSFYTTIGRVKLFYHSLKFFRQPSYLKYCTNLKEKSLRLASQVSQILGLAIYNILNGAR